MDNLTHTAIGLFLSRAGLNRRTPLATPILLVAANAPDIDIVSAAGGALNYLHFHRHLTHSFFLMPVMAALSVLLVRLIARKPVQWVWAFVAALIGVGSHLALDWTNVYAIRLLLPFSGRWLSSDLSNVFDIWIWVVALLSVAAPFLGRLVNSEITSSAAKPRAHGRGFAWFALLFVLLYDGGRAVLHQQAVATLSSRVYQDESPLRVVAVPDAFNPWLWRGIVETSGLYAVADVDLHSEFDPERATIFHKPEADPAIEAARRDPTFARFLEFAQYPLWRVSPAPEPDTAKIVEVADMRLGFSTHAIVTNRLQVIDPVFHFGGGRPR
jgi:inner membrane protein